MSQLLLVKKKGARRVPASEKGEKGAAFLNF
jgi:hypothetical protein